MKSLISGNQFSTKMTTPRHPDRKTTASLWPKRRFYFHFTKNSTIYTQSSTPLDKGKNNFGFKYRLEASAASPNPFAILAGRFQASPCYWSSGMPSRGYWQICFQPLRAIRLRGRKIEI